MNYQEIAPNSRVWIYQSNRELTENEVVQIKEAGRRFIANWSTHGTALHAALEVFFDRFIVLFADEAQVKASGCSIDSSVHFIKEVEKAFSINLFDRMQIAYSDKQIEGLTDQQRVDTIHMNDLRSRLESGKSAEDIYIFNNLVATKAELESNWIVPVKESWLYKQMAR